MDKEYKLKSVKMISSNYNDATAILKRNIELLTIPEGASAIPSGVFRSLTTLKKVIIPKSVTRIEGMCFYNCTNLETLEYLGKISEWNSIYKGYAWSKETKLVEVVCIDGTAPIEEA